MASLRAFSNTSNLLRVMLTNSSTGAGLTGLTSASSGLIISTIADVEASATVYTVASSNVETISTLGTFATPTSSKCRFKEVDATNHPGLYEIQLADARYAVSNARRLLVTLSGATNLLTTTYEIELVQFNPFDSVRLGLTALPNATAGASSGLPLSVDSSGRVDVLKINGTSQTARDIGASVLLSSGTGTGQLDFTSGVVKANATQFAGQTITAAAGVTLPSSVASPTNITAGTITTVSNVSDKTGYSLATPPLDAAATRAAVGLASANLDTQIATLATASALATVVGYVDTEVAAIKAKTDNLPASPAATGDAMTLTSGERNSVADALLARTLGTESYAADGSVPTLAQMLFMVWSALGDFSISGTTLTCKKLDGSTTSMTFTLDSATAPTSRTRSS